MSTSTPEKVPNSTAVIPTNDSMRSRATVTDSCVNLPTTSKDEDPHLTVSFTVVSALAILFATYSIVISIAFFKFGSQARKTRDGTAVSPNRTRQSPQRPRYLDSLRNSPASPERQITSEDHRYTDIRDVSTDDHYVPMSPVPACPSEPSNTTIQVSTPANTNEVPNASGSAGHQSDDTTSHHYVDIRDSKGNETRGSVVLDLKPSEAQNASQSPRSSVTNTQASRQVTSCTVSTGDEVTQARPKSSYYADPEAIAVRPPNELTPQYAVLRSSATDLREPARDHSNTQPGRSPSSLSSRPDLNYDVPRSSALLCTKSKSTSSLYDTPRNSHIAFASSDRSTGDGEKLRPSHAEKDAKLGIQTYDVPKNPSASESSHTCTEPGKYVNILALSQDPNLN